MALAAGRSGGKGRGHLGAGHSVTLISRSSLAILRHQAGEPTAVSDLAVVADDMERALGPADPTTVGTRKLLSSWETIH
ncbi:hypothetical protein ACIA8K_33015 [Catenuloplanes sp. NPDC051500]|uniref:hypothetical protein n=1 Tax=Catenuloplanes sp. NPDC051500 TaxID=3363959 RepID=UPI0037A3F3EE